MDWKLSLLFTGVFILGFTSLSLSQEMEDAVVTTEELGEEEEGIVEDIMYSSPTPSGSVYLAHHFDDLNNFKQKWILSEAKKDDIDEDIAKYDGKWEVEAPQRNGLKGDLGLVLKTKAKHAAISSRLDRPFVFATKPLIVQYEVTLQEGQECGGAYLKLLSLGKGTADLRQFHDRTPYTIMFGPDKCGNDHKLHFIFRHRNPVNGTFSEKHCKKPKDRLEEPFKDKLPHLYTLVVRPDNTFSVSLDHKVINEGSLLEDFTPAVNPAAEVDDPEDRRPEDWDEREKIPDLDSRKPDDWDEEAPATIADTSATKPEGWLDDEPDMIADPNAEKPEDWDTEMDGDWEAPLIVNPKCEGGPGCGPWKAPMMNNPAYRGKWRAQLIDNPNYRGKWKPRKIPNPGFFEDKLPYKMADIAAVGFELWSMSSQILFDNIIITDDSAVALKWAEDTFSLKRRKLDKDGESLFTRLWNYTNDQPWLWAVYLVAVGLPLVLILVFCCSSSSQEKDEEERRAADSKKTDAPNPDDLEEEPELEPMEVQPATASKSQLDVPDSQPGEEEEEVEVPPEEEEEEEEVTEQQAAGDAPGSPRKRAVRKE